MIINFSPVRMDEQLQVRRQGNVLEINGEVFDFGPLTEGATIPQSAIMSSWFAGPVERIDGELVLTLVLPHGANAPEETRFPQSITMVSDGLMPLPIHDSPEETVDATSTAEEREE